MTIHDFPEPFGSEEAARVWFEGTRWPDGPTCPKCGVVDRVSRVFTRPGPFTCLGRRHRYSVTSGTALHGTKLPLRTWLVAMYLITSRSNGISAMKLAAWLGISYKTAWDLGHRIRGMMVEGSPLLAGVVEVDDTYVGGKPRRIHRERLLPKDERPKRNQGRATDKASPLERIAFFLRLSGVALPYGALTA